MVDCVGVCLFAGRYKLKKNTNTFCYLHLNSVQDSSSVFTVIGGVIVTLELLNQFHTRI